MHQYFPIMGERYFFCYYIVHCNNSSFISFLLVKFISRILLKVILINCKRMLKNVLEIYQEACLVLD